VNADEDSSPSARGAVVVVGIGDIDEGRPALEAAAAEARRRGARLRVVCCWNVPGTFYASGVPVTPTIEHMLEASATDRLAGCESWLARNHPGLELELRTVQAPLPAGLVEAAGDADLLVVASRHRGKVTRWFLGSACKEIRRTARCPVHVVELQ